MGRPPAQDRGTRDTSRTRDEGKIYGVNACLAFFARRPDDLVRLWIAKGADRRLGDVMKFCAARRLAYHIVENEELERVTESTHHEGVCMLVRRNRPWNPAEWTQERLKKGPCCVLGLAGVSNPHNVGNILRSAAHFGSPAICLENPGAAMSGAAVRVAEGGAETVDVVKAGGWPATFSLFREAGFAIVATSSHGGIDLFEAQLPDRCLVLIGAEGEGLARGLVMAADMQVRISGTGAVESLNAAASAAVLLAEHRRGLDHGTAARSGRESAVPEPGPREHGRKERRRKERRRKEPGGRDGDPRERGPREPARKPFGRKEHRRKEHGHREAGPGEQVHKERGPRERGGKEFGQRRKRELR